MQAVVAEDDDSKYVRVYQTWNLLQPTIRTSAPVPESTAPDSAPTFPSMNADDTFRYKVQMARVDKGWSIQKTAEMAKCDAAALAAYERGDTVLSTDLHRTLKQVLNF